ncbi:MAG TPA: VOC family protein [Patescibacteria group bacterium]|nr:VOC family protein [Patescibacteria group bacterium]
MPPKAGYSTPLYEVAEIERSIRFYELLGFTVIDTDRCTPLGWARMHCDGGAIMFLRADGPLNARGQSVYLAMYTPDLAGLRAHLLASGIAVPPIRYPEYMPSGMIELSDPDGYRLGIHHWGKSEQDAWEKRISEKS